jgi:hypothetical protein
MSGLRSETVSQILVISNSAPAIWTFRGCGILLPRPALTVGTASTRSECSDMIQQRNIGKSGLRVQRAPHRQVQARRGLPAGSRFATVKDRDYAAYFVSEAN